MNKSNHFSPRFLFVITMIQILSWFVNSATYYGLTLAASSESSSESESSSSSSGGSERYLKTALSGAVEIPAYVLTTMLLAKITRLWTLCGFMISGGAALLAVLFTAPISAVSCEARTSSLLSSIQRIITIPCTGGS